ncbi:MAG: DUF302 domain-containing protein [Methylococcales bacterium]|nr:DUF302 domain-containing protein [Methylococcales bacterium]
MKVANIIIGFILGVVMTGIIVWLIMPGMMLTERQSPYGVDETVAKITANAKAEGWVISSIQPLHQSVKKHGGGDLSPVILINLCQANHAYNILKEDDNKLISVMMPCTISVYQKSDGYVYVGTMNARLLGTMFGGKVAEVMGGTVAAQQKKFIAFLKK